MHSAIGQKEYPLGALPGSKCSGIVVFCVLPFNVRTKGLVSEQGEIECSGDVAKVAVSSKPFANTKLVAAKTLHKGFKSFDVLS